MCELIETSPPLFSNFGDIPLLNRIVDVVTRPQSIISYVMSATKFVKDGKSVWTNGNIVSSAIQNVNSSFNLETGFITEEKHIMFIKGNSEDAVTKQVDMVINAINAGKLATYRAFSKTPFYDTQESDMNPSTGEVLNRYSQVRLCPADKFMELNRQFVAVATTVKAEPIAAEA